MKPRHATALTLVGWYLMVPPTLRGSDPACQDKPSVIGRLVASSRGDKNALRCADEAGQLASGAPLSDWNQEGEFETLTDCRTERGHQLTAAEAKQRAATNAVPAKSVDPYGLVKHGLLWDPDAKKEIERINQESATRVAPALLAASKCIASDDPRLK
jgi:hypothetical protein